MSRVKLLLKIIFICELSNFANYLYSRRSEIGLPRKLYATTGGSARFRTGVTTALLYDAR